jgi:hypothetical protein
VILPLESFGELLLVQLLFPRSGTTLWYLRYPAQFVVGGLLGIVAGACKRKWGWVVWGSVAGLYGTFWVLVLITPE